jgi:hypothetical protein
MVIRLLATASAFARCECKKQMVGGLRFIGRDAVSELESDEIWRSSWSRRRVFPSVSETTF